MRELKLLPVLVLLLAATNVSALALLPWRRRTYGGFPSAKINYLSLGSLFTENIPQIILQVENARRLGSVGLRGVALLSVVFSGLAIVVKTLLKVFEGLCAGGSSGGDGGDGDGPRRPRGKTRAENRELREQLRRKDEQLDEKGRQLDEKGRQLARKDKALDALRARSTEVSTASVKIELAVVDPTKSPRKSQKAV